MVKVLIVGATGNPGNLIAHQAVKEGHQVLALIREDTQTAKKQMVGDLVGAGVKIVTGSLESDHKQLVEVLKSVEAVRAQHEHLIAALFRSLDAKKTPVGRKCSAQRS